MRGLLGVAAGVSWATGEPGREAVQGVLGLHASHATPLHPIGLAACG